jgi:N-acetyl-anhydromuramyl-L-alanine amidase AmpD
MIQIEKLQGFKPQGKYKRKKQIVLCHSSRVAQDYLSSLKYRHNGNNPYLPHYVINRDGQVLSLIPPDSYSKFLETDSHNKSVIVICLENLGWLKKNPLSGYYVNWIGNIYNQGIFEKKWRNHFFWQPYTDIQIEVLSELVGHLCETFEIPKTCIGHNVKVNGVERFEGIVSKSNYDSDYTDLSPAFNFEEFKKIIENESIRRD